MCCFDGFLSTGIITSFSLVFGAFSMLLCHQLSSVAPQNKVRILLGFIIAQSFRTEAQFEQLARFLFGCDTGQLNVLAALIIYLDTPHRTEALDGYLWIFLERFLDVATPNPGSQVWNSLLVSNACLQAAMPRITERLAALKTPLWNDPLPAPQLSD